MQEETDTSKNDEIFDRDNEEKVTVSDMKLGFFGQFIVSEQFLTKLKTKLSESSLLEQFDRELLLSRIYDHPEFLDGPRYWSFFAGLFVPLVAVLLSFHWSAFLYIGIFVIAMELFGLVGARLLGTAVFGLVDAHLRSGSLFDNRLLNAVCLLRTAEVQLFGSMKGEIGKLSPCFRSLRIVMLTSLRTVVRNYIKATQMLIRFTHGQSLLSSCLTDEMEVLVMHDDVDDNFLLINTLKELWQFAFLLRSEFICFSITALLEGNIWEFCEALMSMWSKGRSLNIHSTKIFSLTNFLASSNDVPSPKVHHSPTATPSSFETATLLVKCALEMLTAENGEDKQQEAITVLHSAISLLEGLSDEAVKEVFTDESRCETPGLEHPPAEQCDSSPKVFEGISAGPSESGLTGASLLDDYAEEKVGAVNPATRALMWELKAVLAERGTPSDQKESVDVDTNSSPEDPVSDDSFIEIVEGLHPTIDEVVEPTLAISPNSEDPLQIRSRLNDLLRERFRPQNEQSALGNNIVSDEVIASDE